MWKVRDGGSDRAEEGGDVRKTGEKGGNVLVVVEEAQYLRTRDSLMASAR